MLFVSNLDPVALTLGPVSLRWYGILFAGGFIAGYFIMHYMFRRKHYNTEDLDRLLLYIFAGTVIGARLAHCFIYEPDFYLAHPLEIVKVWKGGLASHGGTLGVVIAIWFFARKNRFTFLEVADMLCIPVSLVCVLIRTGNFINSEILGVPTHADYGVIFAAIGENFPRHPVQLYEAFAYLLIFIIITSVYFLWKKCPRGFILGLLLFLVFGSRFALEPFKVEQADYSTGIILSVGQLLSIPFVITGAVLMFYACAKSEKEKEQ